MNWFWQKMKVKIAAQTLSNSVATALEYLKTLRWRSLRDQKPL